MPAATLADTAALRVSDEDVPAAEDPDHTDVPDHETDSGATSDLDEAAPAADLMRVYLNEIGRTALLSAAQEVELARRIEAGVYAAELLRRHDAGEERIPPRRRRALEAVAEEGATAKDHMLRANLRLVVSVAKKFGNRGVPLGDIIQEGNVGLVRAVEKFDYTKGFKFSTYATWWIRQAITRAMADQARTIRIPVHMVEVINKLAVFSARCCRISGANPRPKSSRSSST